MQTNQSSYLDWESDKQMSENLSAAIDKFLSKNDKAVLSWVASPEYIKWYHEFFYGVKHVNQN